MAIPVIIKVAEVKHLYDEPGGRKLHKSRVPTLGGLAIFSGLVFTLTFWTNFSTCPHLQHVIAAMVVIIFIGLQDDILGLSPFKKLIGQVLAAAIVVVWGHIRITHMFGILGVSQLPEIVSILFSIATIVLIINAINLIDGINGLAASLSIIAAFTLGIFFVQSEQNSQHAIISFALAGALISFLRFNLTPARIFLGDTGSMLVGLVLSVLCFEFIIANEPSALLPAKLKAAPVIAMAVIFIPLYDLFRVFSLRILKGKSPFYPDQNHLHHSLLRLGLSHIKATLVLSLFSLVIIFTAFILRSLNVYLLGFILLSFCLGFTYYLQYRVKKKGPVNINGKE
jgi:UDP-N-acetylmuramyl pentapeptide phosphotransferase/UDP-N-acetylglucosamine-1-phosphate transferase